MNILKVKRHLIIEQFESISVDELVQFYLCHFLRHSHFVFVMDFGVYIEERYKTLRFQT
jgi:hypothetical protein